MYSPGQYEETRLDAMHQLVDAHPLGAVVVNAAGGLDADHIPFEMAPPGAGAPFGTLRAHVARANPLWQQDGAQVLVLFQGPQAYVSPAFYDEKAVSGKVVPTWNYAVVHAHGRLRAVEDPAWLLALLARLTGRHEAQRAEPWSIGDAPRDYIDALLKAIVGIEIVIERIEGKWKASQNRSQGERERIAAGVGELENGRAMAQLMRTSAPLPL
jgi:transcriptional regulator